MAKRAATALRMAARPSKFNGKEAEGKVLAKVACVKIYQSAWYIQADGFAAQVRGENLDKAVALRHQDSAEAGMIVRGLINLKEISGTTVSEKEVEKKHVLDTLVILGRLIEDAAEGELLARLSNVRYLREGLAKTMCQLGL